MLSKEQTEFYERSMIFIEKESYEKKDKRKVKSKMNIIATWILSMFEVKDKKIAEILDRSEKTILFYKDRLVCEGFMTEDFISKVDVDNFEIDIIMLSLCLDGFVKTSSK